MRVKTLFSILIIIILVSASYFFASYFFNYTYSKIEDVAMTEYDLVFKNKASVGSIVSNEETKEITHIKTPEKVKAVYMTSWVAGTENLREKLLDKIKDTEINSIVIDIKDYTGKISFNVEDASLKEINSGENRISNIVDIVDMLHDKGLYVIGRVAVFQDSYLIKTKPELAVKRNSDKTKVWTDKKGIGWLDVGEQEVWDYTIAIAKQSYAYGFDEINFDYIRFPSDGDMKDIYYPSSDGKNKIEMLESFFKYLNEELNNTGIVTSADLFGMTTTVKGDMNIGQVLEKALPYFDFVCPMVYPSHYPPDWNGFDNPAENPYEVVSISMKSAVERAIVMSEDKEKLRPWLQDFDLGAVYTKDKVRDQIRATYDSTLDSWMLWDPSNTYTIDALEKE